MGKMAGLIACNYSIKDQGGLIQDRPLGALPFGGRYRLLDFALSNMVNSGMRTVGIIMPYQYRPIMDHLGAGKEWFLDRKTGGLFILSGAAYGIHSKNNKFILKDILKNIEYLIAEQAEYVVISGINNIFQIDYRKVLQQHQEMASQITLLYKEQPLVGEEDPQGVSLVTDTEGRVQKIIEAKGQAGQQIKYFADSLIIRRTLLMEIVQDHENLEDIDLLDILKSKTAAMNISAYPISGYFGRVYSKQTYFERSMELLQPSVQNELFLGEQRVLTRIQDNPPTKFGTNGVVRNSLVSSRCMIKGNVSNSIIFRRVHIEVGASINNCIVMQKCWIGADSVLENVIIDKYAQILPGTVVKGQAGNAVVITKRRVV